MKNSLLIVGLFLLFVGSSTAQITVTNSIFVNVGDVLSTRHAASPGSVTNVTAAGPNQTWDFTSIISGALKRDTITAASAGSSAALFPDAHVVMPDLFLTGENYVKINADSYELLGAAGDPLGIGISFPVRFNDPKIIVQTPLNYQDAFVDVSDFQVALKVSDFPDLQNLIDSLVPPQTGIVVDSLRVTYTDSVYNEVDAWGSLTLPATTLPTDTYNVLRLKQRTESNLVVEFRGSFAGIPFAWTDPSLPPISLTLPFAGPTSTIVYQYLNDAQKEPIAAVTVGDPNNAPTAITAITFKSDQLDTTSSSVFGFAAPLTSYSATAYPNPVMDNLNLKFKNFAPGEYEIKIYNIVGLELMNTKEFIAGEKTISMDVSQLRRGTYLYSIVDSNGETILTKRIIVARP